MCCKNGIKLFLLHRVGPSLYNKSMDTFKSILTQKEGKILVRLIGCIDADTELPEITFPQGDLAFNFSEVIHINSLGVRTWVNYLKGLKGFNIELQECSPLIVRQIIMTPSFSSHAKVVSAYFPYSCDQCSSKMNVLVTKKEWDQNGKTVAEVLHCDKCNQDCMELDGDAEQFKQLF